MMSESSLDYCAMEGDATAVRLLSGVDTLCELLVARRALDARAGLDTATFVSGYPGSPLGGFDLALGRLGDRAAGHRIVHRPGLNEELAAAAVWGSQMGEAVPYEGVDGVVGAWYRKGPGLDRSGDVLKHANLMGSGPGGGAVLFVGDDPSAKPSTLPYDTNLALADASVPVLVPADQQDLFDLGVEAFRLSRFCGSWVGVRIVTAVADGVAAVHTRLDRFPEGDPEVVIDGRPWRHEPAGQILRGDLEELWLDRRLRAAQGWVAARGLDRTVGAEGPARLGIVCAGKTYRDVLGALEACGADPATLGIRVLKLAMTYPLVPATVAALAASVDEILVVEEKRPFVEQQVRAVLQEAGEPTPVRGTRDRAGDALVPVAGELTADRLVPVLGRILPSPTRTSTRWPGSTCGSTSGAGSGCATTSTHLSSGGWGSTTSSPSGAGPAGWRSGAWPPCATCAARRSTSSATPATGGRSASWPTSTPGWWRGPWTG
jgi:indolepyruvate ferredoxin oxidoreductase